MLIFFSWERESLVVRTSEDTELGYSVAVTGSRLLAKEAALSSLKGR